MSEWTVIEKTATATFWFSIETDDIVGYQFESLDPQQGEVGVVTYMFNLFTGFFFFFKLYYLIYIFLLI